MPNLCFDDCAVIEKDTAEGLAKACRVISSGDCTPQTHWISHWISQTSWYREILIFQLSWEGRTEMQSEEEKSTSYEKSSTCVRKDKKAEWKILGPGYVYSQCQPQLFPPVSHLSSLSLLWKNMINKHSNYNPYLFVFAGLKKALSSFNKTGAAEEKHITRTKNYASWLRDNYSIQMLFKAAGTMHSALVSILRRAWTFWVGFLCNVEM